MKKTLTLLVATTALTAAIGVPAWSAMESPSDVLRPVAALFDDARKRCRSFSQATMTTTMTTAGGTVLVAATTTTTTMTTMTATTMMTTTIAAVALAIPRPPTRSPLRRTASSGTALRRRFR